MHHLATLFQSSSSFQAYAQGYTERLAAVLKEIDRDALAQAVEIIDQAFQAQKALYVIANGGSAAVAAHIVNDLVAGGYVEGPPPFRVFSLSDNLATVTALGNDAGFDYIFERQLRVYLNPGDVVLAMSVSGNSPNILNAVAYARAHEAKTIGFCGFTGGKLAPACDVSLHIPTTLDEYGPVEDAFSVLGHIFVGYLSMKRGKLLHH
ncbi:MAG TPA: SIS domain-containing protein [Candidatus Hydrogenedentes bacterium]|nr:SIS domain-containing protein [Candidatus Hydrogenedentota bacterium]